MKSRIIMNIREIRNIIVAGIFLFSFELFLFSQSPVELNKEGIKLGNKKKYNEAMKKFNQSAAIFDKVSAGVYYNRGLAQEKVKNIGGAIASYQEVIKRDPSHANGHGRLGFWLFKQGNYPEAIKRGEKSLELKPGNKVVIKWLVQAYAKNLEKKRKDKIPKAPKKGGEEKKKTLAQVAREKKKPKIFYVAFDMSFIEKYEIENEGFQFHSEEGKLVNLPMEVHFWVKPTPLFIFKFFSNPYFT